MGSIAQRHTYTHTHTHTHTHSLTHTSASALIRASAMLSWLNCATSTLLLNMPSPRPPHTGFSTTSCMSKYVVTSSSPSSYLPHARTHARAYTQTHTHTHTRLSFAEYYLYHLCLSLSLSPSPPKTPPPPHHLAPPHPASTSFTVLL